MSLIQYDNQNLTEWPKINEHTTDIRISNNKIKKIPDSIGEIKALTRIIIDNNQVDTISKKIETLNNFIDLRMANNNLKQIPNTIYYLKKLSILILNNNAIETIEEKIGQLSSLTQLHLQNNPIEYLHPSIKKLTKLTHLQLTGTKLPLPPGYNPAINISGTIDYILAKQKEPPSSLFINKAFLFFNFSKESLIKKLNDTFEEFSERYEVSFDEITDSSMINNDTTIVLIIVGYDSLNDENLIFQIIKKCTKLTIPYKILYQKNVTDIEYVNLSKAPIAEITREKLEKTHTKELISFTSNDELGVLTLNVLKEHKPEVLINSLNLVNIGHFEKVTVDFDKQLTCIVGENGQGKSSILKSLALAIIGPNNSKIDKDSYKNLLRIESVIDGDLKYCEIGSITLNYSVDSINYQNTIILNAKDEGRLIEATSSGDFQFTNGEFNLKSLIVGFPQLSGILNNGGKTNKSQYSQPHVDDIIPLLNSSNDNRLDSFVDWIANLFGEAIKEANYKESSEYQIIEYVFDVISDLTEKDISFMTVKQFTPPVVIISTPHSPNGIPLDLISQGFKIVIGWIGYFIQRRAEAFPLSSPSVSSSEKSILIIDEIDSSIHPVWQSRLLKVLREKFPLTQIICTTHSPLMLSGLDREQIQEIQTIEEGILEVNQNDFDTWATSYSDILKVIFNTSEMIPKYTKEELEKLLELSDDENRQREIQQIINQLIENEVLVDDLRKYEISLQDKELELDTLIEEYKIKNQ